MPSSDPVNKLVFELSKLPGIGNKTATRLAYFILKQKEEFALALSNAILEAKRQTRLCSVCFTFTDQDPCRICNDPKRESHSICVVERPSDVAVIDQTGSHRGRYHVLHGALSPLDGIGPHEIKIQELLDSIRDHSARDVDALDSSVDTEVILALNPSIEGDATALYLARLLQPLKIRVTKLAHGIPVGGQLEFTDRQTLSRAIENRMEIH